MAKTKTDRIRDMLAAKVEVSAIARKVGVSKSYVYAVKSRTKKKAKRKVPSVAPAAEPVQVTPVPTSALDVQMGGNHYKDMEIQPIEYIVANNLNFLEGCIVKRISRWRTKQTAAEGIADLEKIKHEVDLLIELMA